MKETTRDMIIGEIEAYIKRVVTSNRDRKLTGRIRLDIHLSQSGCSTVEASFTERLRE